MGDSSTGRVISLSSGVIGGDPHKVSTQRFISQIPGRQRLVEFGNFQTSGASILVHSVLYFALICIFLLAVGVHVYEHHHVHMQAHVCVIPGKANSLFKELLEMAASVPISQRPPSKPDRLKKENHFTPNSSPSPHLQARLPGSNRRVDFGSLKTNGMAIAVHTLIFFTVYAILILVVHVHIYTG
ncbi:hypothetical protein SADUNF_Sadunf16G0206900 [Salix dunnii]|uniref:Uncharacterized protein n=1 Tax=Salix dunnii TaxID=1413687 RepID=A0A835JFF5_9ROSI|nr:hypothetical protein SADUNF_Sadunf16G0206900 [Salix dunnii]